MKNLSLFLLFMLVSKMIAQTQTITICSENNGCEFAKVNLSKSQIDHILEKPNFLATEKGEVILNLVDCVSSIQKGQTPQAIHEAFNGKGLIKERKNFDLKKYLFDKGCRVECKQPAAPNAGQDALITIGLNGNFTFNQKLTFSITSSEGNVASYFYMNTKSGYSMMDNPAMQKMTNEPYDGEICQIFTSNADIYQYIKSSEGNFAMKVGSKNDASSRSSDIGFEVKKFFKEFKKTGNKRNVGTLFESEEYSGKDDEGTPMSVWLACANNVLLDTKITTAITGFWGLGYISSPSATTYLITGFESKEVKINLTRLENQNISFSGKTYTPVGSMMAQAISQNDIQTHLGGENENPEMQKMVEEMIKSSQDFAQTSDIQDLPSSKMAGSIDFTTTYYDFIINQLEQSVIDNNKAITDLNKTLDDYSRKQIASLKCLNGCAVKEKARYENLKKEHLTLLRQYQNEEEVRDQKISDLMQKNAIPEPCNCN